MGRLQEPGLTDAVFGPGGPVRLGDHATGGRLVEQVELVPLGQAYRTIDGTGRFNRAVDAHKLRVTLSADDVAAPPDLTSTAGAAVIGQTVAYRPITMAVPDGLWRVVAYGGQLQEADQRWRWRLVLEQV